MGQRLGFLVFLVAAAQFPDDIGVAVAAGEAEPSRPVVFRVPPHAHFLTPDAVMISWETDGSSEGGIEYGLGEKWDRQVQDAGPKTAHRVTLRDLEPRARYQYRVRTNQGGNTNAVSEPFELDNALNYAVARVPENGSPYPSNARSQQCIQAAEHILTTTGITRGYCLLLDCNDGQLAYELAKRSELIILGVDRDPDRVARARALLTKAGVYGSRITLRQADPLEHLPCPRSFANLVVVDGSQVLGKLPASAAQIVSWLQPATGVAFLGPLPGTNQLELRNGIAKWIGDMKVRWDLVESPAGGWARLRSEPPPNTGSWTHEYGDAGNTANSQEGLQGVAATDRLDVQWLGRPGADFGLDRNPRMPAPLAINGRLFHQGLNRLMAMDSYNGAVLWLAEIPALRRVNMPRDCGNWCADAEHLYVAVKNQCWVVAAETGELLRALPLADAGLRASHEWGYVARVADLLYGSSVKQGAVYTDFWGQASWYDATFGPGYGEDLQRRPVCVDQPRRAVEMALSRRNCDQLHHRDRRRQGSVRRVPESRGGRSGDEPGRVAEAVGGPISRSPRRPDGEEDLGTADPHGTWHRCVLPARQRG